MPIAPASEDHGILLAWFAAIVLVTIVPLLWSARSNAKQANSNAKQANDAVNHRHVDGDQPRIFDAVLEVLEWKRRWDQLPADLDDADHLVVTIDRLTDEVASLQADVADIRRLIRERRDTPPPD